MSNEENQTETQEATEAVENQATETQAEDTQKPSEEPGSCCGSCT